MRARLAIMIQQCLLILLIGLAILLIGPVMLVVDGPAECRSYFGRLMRIAASPARREAGKVEVLPAASPEALPPMATRQAPLRALPPAPQMSEVTPTRGTV